MDDTRKGRNNKRQRRREFFQLASEQGGYFTAAQARSHGFSRALLAHHTKTGHFVRVRQGLYRFRDYPSSPHEDVIAAWVATGKDVAAVSHESALDILGLSDVVPENVHVTVSRARRYRSSSPGIVIHTTTRELSKSDVVVREGMRVTGATRSIVDAAEVGTAPEQVMAAVGQALERGMTTQSRLLAAAKGRGKRVENLVRQAVEERRPQCALEGVFAGRRQHSLSNRLPRPPKDWAVPYRKMASEVGIEPELHLGYQHAAALLDPILSGRTTGRWDPELGGWV